MKRKTWPVQNLATKKQTCMMYWPLVQWRAWWQWTLLPGREGRFHNPAHPSCTPRCCSRSRNSRCHSCACSRYRRVRCATKGMFTTLSPRRRSHMPLWFARFNAFVFDIGQARVYIYGAQVYPTLAGFCTTTYECQWAELLRVKIQWGQHSLAR